MLRSPQGTGALQCTTWISYLGVYYKINVFNNIKECEGHWSPSVYDVPMEEEEHLLGRSEDNNDHQSSSDEDGFQHV